MRDVSFGRKVGICLMLLLFGGAALFMSLSDSDYDLQMKELSSRGLTVTVHRSAYNPRHDGLNRTYYESIYEYEVGGRTYRHIENSYPQWDDSPPAEVEVLAYLPEDPGEAKLGLPKWQRNRVITFSISGAFLCVGLISVLVTLARRQSHAEAYEGDWDSARDRAPENESRVFDYRRPTNLLVALVLIPVCIFMPVAVAMSADRGEIRVNGAAGSPMEQWLGVIFVSVISLAFLVVAIFLMLTYFNERIVWDKGFITSYDRMGKIRVKSPISEIMEVRTGAVTRGDGRHAPIYHVTIRTHEGEITFPGHMPGRGF